MEPTDLAFNHLFGDKMRRIIDFDTVDKSTGLGKLVSLWPDGGDTFSFGDYGDNAFKWVPDFSTGTVSRLSPNDYIRKAGLEKRAIRDPFGAGLYGAPTSPEKEKPKKEDIRRETMKIGKFLSKGERLAAKHEVLDKQLEDAQAEYDDNIRLGRAERDAETRKKMNDLQDQQRDVRGELFRFVSHDSSPLKPESWQELAKFWQQNADFLKKNPEGANSDTYKIILSRHPIDILRMSDFRQYHFLSQATITSQIRRAERQLLSMCRCRSTRPRRYGLCRSKGRSVFRNRHKDNRRSRESNKRGRRGFLRSRGDQHLGKNKGPTLSVSFPTPVFAFAN